ncbi:hypothetical protein CKA32_005592 [Geitlerinema sp. FC II]|nr:hypothetical protein CKA32_005592 [Geitlerinema sp. FC II]
MGFSTRSGGERSTRSHRFQSLEGIFGFFNFILVGGGFAIACFNP